MLKKNEEKALSLLLTFAKKNEDFRFTVLDEVPFQGCDFQKRNIFITINGVYKTRVISLGYEMEYGDPDNPIETDFEIFYCIRSDSKFDAHFIKEKARHKLMKGLGLDIEIQVGNQLIDDNYLITSSKPQIVSKLAGEWPLNPFLINNRDILELFQINKDFVEFHRAFDIKKEGIDEIVADLETLFSIIDKVEG
jgi:hypothetical protein